ncbi:MAG: NAD(P)/FAD-dependent oxidoreductase [Actinomycetota bacterium]
MPAVGTERIVIAGGGLAGGNAAAALRERGFDGDVILVGEEPDPPYDRPPLSKAYLRGENPDLAARPVEFWADNRIELRLGERVERIHPGDKAAMLHSGERLPYDRLLIATGGVPRRLRVPGADLDGIHLLRTVADAARLRDAAASAGRAVVVGMGFIGAEVAATLRARGLEVVAVEPFATPLERVLGADVGRSVERLHRDHGVAMRLGDTVTEFQGDGRVERVVTGSGERIECDLAVVGVGIAPATELLEGSGVAVDNGVLVDAQCRTGVQGIYAAGDVANHDHPLFGRVRVEHWQNAIKQGGAAARSMLGADEPYAEIHWFWSDQYDSTVQYAGHHAGPAEILVRGSLDAPPFVAFYVSGGILRAAFGFDAGRDVRRAMALIGKPADAERLTDPDVDLKALAAES